MSIITCRSHLAHDLPTLFNRRPAENLFQYVGGTAGTWRITSTTTLSGTSLRPATHVEIVNGLESSPLSGAAWILRGAVKHTRFVTREERPDDVTRLDRFDPSEATCAALIPIRKSAEWWNLEHDERQELIAAQSRRIAFFSRYLPAMAKRFLYGLNLGDPFDLVTWFEYSPRDAAIFDDLAGALRSSEEWRFVEREIDIRLVRE